MSVGTLRVLPKPIIWFFCEIGHWVKDLSEEWSEKVAQRPPDPETNKVVRDNQRKKRQRLSQAVSLIMTLPMTVNPANARLITGMARKICTGNWMSNEAATLHDLLLQQ